MNLGNPGIEFWVGLGAGSLIVFVINWLWGLYRGWIGAVDAFQRDVVFRHPTGVVPADVARQARRARQALLWMRLGIVLVVWGLIEAVLFPGFTEAVLVTVGDIVEFFFG